MQKRLFKDAHVPSLKGDLSILKIIPSIMLLQLYAVWIPFLG